MKKEQRVYTWIFAGSEDHEPIITLKQLRLVGTYSANMGFYLNGKAIGTGSFCRENWNKKHLHSESMRLFKGHRRKGYGVELYKALISCARTLGAKRLYSSRSLNKFSRRMWKEKLGKAGFLVKNFGGCKHCGHNERYYIDL